MAKAFAQDQFAVSGVESRVEFGALGTLHAMLRPKHLGPIVELNRLKGYSLGMARGK